MQAILARLLTAVAVMLFCAPAMAQTCTGAYPGSCVFQDDGVPKEFPTLGENGGTAGSLKLVGSGTGYVLIQVPAGTITSYNFNLPATVGPSGSFLTSAGGGTSPTTWTAQVGPAQGGTGVTNNAASTITLSAYPLAFTYSGPVSLTLPTSGTLATTAAINTALPNITAAQLYGGTGGAGVAQEFTMGVGVLGNTL